MTDIQIGSSSEGVVVSMRDGQNPDLSEGWLGGEVWVKAGAWSGKCAAMFLEDDLMQLMEGLKRIMAQPGSAFLSSTDGYVDLELTRDGSGHVEVAGEAWDTPRYGSHLTFSFQIDQTYLPPILTSLESFVGQLRSG